MLCDSECDSLQITMICQLVHGHVVRPFFLNKPTTNKTTYLQMLKDHVVAQLPFGRQSGIGTDPSLNFIWPIFHPYFIPSLSSSVFLYQYHSISAP